MARFYSGETADPLIFCHFAENIQDKVYDMVGSINKLSNVLEDALREYNEVHSIFVHQCIALYCVLDEYTMS